MQKDKVVLKPVFSLPPTVYVPILWALIAGGILFLVFFLHGIQNTGSSIEVRTTPKRASVFIDGEFFSTDADSLFLPSGTYALEVRKTGYRSYQQSITTSNRIFATLFFRPRLRIAVDLELDDEEKIIQALGDALSLSTTISENSVFIGEASLSLAVEEALEIGAEPLAIRLMLAAIPYNAGAHNHADFDQALAMLETFDSELVTRLSTMIQEGYPNIAFATTIISPSLQEILTSSDADPAIVPKTQFFDEAIRDRRRGSGGSLLVAGMPFRFVQGGIGYVYQNTGLVYPQEFLLPDFYIMEEEVSLAQFRAFIDSDYIDGLSDLDEAALYDLQSLEALTDSDAMRFVSLQGARLFARYINDRIAGTAIGQDWTARLPYSQEWEYAALIDDSYIQTSWRAGEDAVSASQGSIGLRAMFGGVWEWTENPFSPLHGYIDESNLSHGLLQEVRGASWIQEKRDVLSTVRGLQNPEWMTPYLGFRIILVRKTQHSE